MDDKSGGSKIINVYEATVDSGNKQTEKFSEAQNSLQELKDSYDKLDQKYKPDAQQLADFEKNIPQATKDFFQSNGLNYQDYMQVAYSSTTFKDEPAVKELSTKYAEFNKTFSLPDVFLPEEKKSLKDCSRLDNVEELTKDNDEFNAYISNNDNFSAVKKTDFGSL